MMFDYFELLSGEPVSLEGIGHIKSPQLKELCPSTGIGYDIYNLYLNFLSWDKDKMLKYDMMIGLKGANKLSGKDKLTVFDVTTLLMQTREFCREILSFFIVENIDWDENRRRFIVYKLENEEKQIVGEINRDNYEECEKAILQLNFIGLGDKEKQVSHSSEHSKELWEKAQKFLKDQAKKEDSEDRVEYHLGNIISKLCATHPSYNYLNVFDLTVFQLYDAFFQMGYMRTIALTEAIFSNHGGDKFRFEDWLKPILQDI